MRWTTLPLLLALASPLAPALATEKTTVPPPEAAENVDPIEAKYGDTPEQVADAMGTEFDGVPYAFTTDGDIVCIGMVQGWKDRLVKLLRQVEVIDDNENWIAGNTHLVNLGNLMGHGGQNLECLELMHTLAQQAEEAGGKVHMLMGSTDFVNLRYMLSTMPPESYEDLATEESQARLDERLGRMLEEMWEYNEGFELETRKQLRRNYERFFTQAHKPGAMEFMDHYAPGTALGDWFREMNTAITINDILFIAGGIHPFYAEVPLEQINAYHRMEANKDAMFVPVMADINTGPYVWRGLSSVHNNVSADEVNAMLADRGFRLMVVGHSPSKYGESLIRHRVVHVDCNFMAAREQAAYNAVIIRDGKLIINNGGRERDLRVPSPLADSQD